MVDADGSTAAEMEDIELHDAVLDRIAWLLGGEVLFQFEHVSTYHTDETGRREVWSSTGVLRFIGVTSFHIDGSTEEKESIFGDSFLDGEGNQVSLGFTVGAVASIARAEIQFGFGAEIRIACSGVVWDSLDPVHKLEDWVD